APLRRDVEARERDRRWPPRSVPGLRSADEQGTARRVQVLLLQQRHRHAAPHRRILRGGRERRLTRAAAEAHAPRDLAARTRRTRADAARARAARARARHPRLRVFAPVQRDLLHPLAQTLELARHLPPYGFEHGGFAP